MMGKKNTDEEYKIPSISPFEFSESITFNKKNLIIDDWSEKQYNPYIVNKSLSFGNDTIIFCNEMNSRPHLDKKMQYDFLRYIIKPRKRYNKWLKAEKVNAIDVIKEYYGYNTEKAHQVSEILTQSQINFIQEKLKKGGLK